MDAPRDPSWLDTETKACLQHVPPGKLAPATTETFSVVVIAFDPAADHGRRARAYQRILKTWRMDAKFKATRTPPFLVKRELSLTDARLAQFELICCDVVSVFIADSVISNATPRYLADLYGTLARSDEFVLVPLVVTSVPPGNSGSAFIDQFIGDGSPALPYRMNVAQKKARIMRHWATKIGAVVECES